MQYHYGDGLSVDVLWATASHEAVLVTEIKADTPESDPRTWNADDQTELAEHADAAMREHVCMPERGHVWDSNALRPPERLRLLFAEGLQGSNAVSQRALFPCFGGRSRAALVQQALEGLHAPINEVRAINESVSPRTSGISTTIRKPRDV